MESLAKSIKMPWSRDRAFGAKGALPLAPNGADYSTSLSGKEPDKTAMWHFILGIVVGTVLTTILVQAAGNNGSGGNTQPLFQNDERERQFHLQLEQMRQQTELEQARMQGKKKPC